MATRAAALRARILLLGGADPCHDRARSEEGNDCLRGWVHTGHPRCPWDPRSTCVPRRALPCLAQGLFNLDVFPEADPMIDLSHGGSRGLVGPGGALAARGTLTDVVELHAMRAGQITLRSGSRAEQVHADGVAREVGVATDLARSFTLGDDLAVPYRFHAHHSLGCTGRFAIAPFDKTTRGDRKSTRL